MGVFGAWSSLKLGVFLRLLTLVLLQKHRDTNGKRIMIQIGGMYTLLSTMSSNHVPFELLGSHFPNVLFKSLLVQSLHRQLHQIMSGIC